MKLSNRSQSVKPSVTLKLNEKASRLAEQGRTIYNLTAGQLPYKPPVKFVEKLSNQLNFLKSFQYSPVKGLADLNEKVLQSTEKSRDISLPRDKFSSLVSCGAKHSLYNVFGALINPGDEVIILSPFWVSYPEMIKVWGGEIKILKGEHHSRYHPDLSLLENMITEKTKAIVINSPNNPAGIHYSSDWMRSFSEVLEKHPSLTIISDEIYFNLAYYDPGPCYHYQFNQDLLERTIIVDGISKSFAGTGLRIGFTIAPSSFIQAMGRLQSHSTSGANSLVQKALTDYSWDEDLKEFLNPIKNHLRKNSLLMKEKLKKNDMSAAWYQCDSAFYFILDFSFSSYFKKKYDMSGDHSNAICEQILEETGVALVPASDFGIANSARISLVSETDLFDEAMNLCMKFLTS